MPAICSLVTTNVFNTKFGEVGNKTSDVGLLMTATVHKTKKVGMLRTKQQILAVGEY